MAEQPEQQIRQIKPWGETASSEPEGTKSEENRKRMITHTI